MRTTLILFILTINQTLLSGQVIIDGKKFNCESATTNYELNICTRYQLDQSIRIYQSTLKNIYKCIDTLIAQDKRDRDETLKKNPSETFDSWTDYCKIKKMLTESSKLFEKHADLERKIEGEFYGAGHERTMSENEREKQLYDKRTIELKLFFKTHCS